MKTILQIILIATLTIQISSCKKNQVGGKGSLSGNVAHHGKPITDAYIYIKFNTTEFPGDDYTLYDTYVTVDGNGNFNIPFYKGDYYLYAKGHDLSIPYPYVVKGGLSVSLRNKEKVSKDIAVSED
jgi:hypothetical protein